jgi:hypothetical protein
MCLSSESSSENFDRVGSFRRGPPKPASYSSFKPSSFSGETSIVLVLREGREGEGKDSNVTNYTNDTCHTFLRDSSSICNSGWGTISPPRFFDDDRHRLLLETTIDAVGRTKGPFGTAWTGLRSLTIEPINCAKPSLD